MILSGMVDRIVAALASGDPEYARQRVCVGLAEVSDCSSRERISRFPEIIVNVVQDTGCDNNKRVRVMAASCFQNLYNLIVPALLVAMKGDDEVEKARAPNGMAGVLSVRSRKLLSWDWPPARKTR